MGKATNQLRVVPEDKGRTVIAQDWNVHFLVCFHFVMLGKVL